MNSICNLCGGSIGMNSTVHICQPRYQYNQGPALNPGQQQMQYSYDTRSEKEFLKDIIERLVRIEAKLNEQD